MGISLCACAAENEKLIEPLVKHETIDNKYLRVYINLQEDGGHVVRRPMMVPAKVECYTVILSWI